MKETLVEVYGHLRGAWKYRWLMLLISWPICLVGWYQVAKMPDQYQASAKVYVDTRSVLQPLLRGMVIGGNSPTAQAELITRTLLTRPNIEKLIQMTDLDVTVNSDRALEGLISSVISRIKMGNIKRRKDMYEISYTDSSPEVAKKIVQALLTIMVEKSLGESRKGGDVAQIFLEEQIAEYEQKLVDSEAKLRNFKQVNVGMMPTDGGGYYTRLQLAKDQLEHAMLELSEAGKRRRAASRQLAASKGNTQASVITEVKITTTSVDERLNAMRQRLDDMLLRYTDIHPNVEAVKAAIVELKSQRDAELLTLNNNVDHSPVKMAESHVSQQLQLILADAEINVASLRERVLQHRKRVSHLAEMVSTIPEVEAEYKKLNRNYGIYKSNYDELVSKREAQQLTEDAARSEDGATFKIIEPPYASPSPIGPKRDLFALVVLAAGLAAGAAFSFLMTQLKPTFDRHRNLIEVTGYPVLGYVSLIRSRADIMKRRVEITFFAMGMGVLIAFFVVIQMLGVRL